MADITAEKQNINAFYSSLGMDVRAGDDANLRLNSISFLHQMNQIFGSAASKKIKVEDYNPEIITAIKEGIAAKIKDTTIELDKLQAIIDEDSDFLAKKYDDMPLLGYLNPRKMAKDTINAIYKDNQAHPENAYRELLAKSDDKKALRFIADTEHHAPHFLDHLPTTVDFLKDPNAILGQLETLHKNKFFEPKIDPTKLAAMDKGDALTQAILWMEKRIEIKKPDGKWGAEEQAKLKTYTLKLQKDPYFGKDLSPAKKAALPDNLRFKLDENEQDGLYNFGFSTHMKLRVQDMPESTVEEQQNKQEAMTFVQTMNVLENRHVELLSSIDRLSVVTATKNIKTGLSGFIGFMNDALEDAENKAGDNFLVKMFAGNLLGTRIPPIEGLDGKFGFEDQASLQGLMMVLSDPMILGLEDKEGETWRYTPEKGALIKKKLRDTKNPPAFLNFMDDKSKKALAEMVKGDDLDQLIESLDYMVQEKQIVQYPVYGQGVGFGDLTKALVADEVERLKEAKNPDAVKLMDALIYKYAPPFGLNNILDEKMEVDLQPSDKKLKALYEKALAQFKKEPPQGYDDFTAFLLPMLDTIQTLPFGYDAHRSDFKAGVIASLNSAGGDGDAFIKGINETLENTQKEHGAIGYTNRFQATPVLHPKLHSFEAMTSEGQSFSADDVITAYNDFHLANARGDNRKYGRSKPLTLHTYIPIKEDDGTIRVAAVDKESMVFTIETVDLKLMERYLYPEKFDDNWVEEKTKMDLEEFKALPLKERSALLKAVDPAYALIFQGGQHGSLSTSPKGFYEYISGAGRQPLRSLAETARHNRKGAQSVQDNAQEIHDKPLISRGSSLDVERVALKREHERAVHNQALGSLSKADRQDLTHYAAGLRASPQIVHEEALALLQRCNGQDDLQIGKGLRSTFRLRGVSMADNPENKPIIAYLDKDTRTVRTMPAPDYLLDVDKRPSFIEALKKHSTEDVNGHYQHIKDRFPKLVEMIDNYRTGGDRQNRTFQIDLNRVSSSLEINLDKTRGIQDVSKGFKEAAQEPEQEEKSRFNGMFGWAKSGKLREPAPVRSLEGKGIIVDPDPTAEY